MAEAAVGVAGLALAVPGLLDLLFKYGTYISERTKVFGRAKTVWEELGRFASNLVEGELHELVELAGSFCDAGCDPVLKASLDLNLRKLTSDVAEVKTFLERVKPDSSIRRMIFTISSERRAREFNLILATDQQELIRTLTINFIHAERFKYPLLLAKNLVLYESQGYQSVSGTSNLFTAQGDYRTRHGGFQKTEIVTERFPIDGSHSEVVLETIARLLHHPASRQGSELENVLRGSLPCLGYRTEPIAELIFARPKGTNTLTMLHTLIGIDSETPRHPLDFRFRLARSLSEAVLGVHIQGLVHKNIRTNTVLVVQPSDLESKEPAQSTHGFGEVYLTNWHLLREVDGATIMNGGTQWTEDIYRHPRRQGTHVQDKYNICHDIYSLGVCLHEVGLWDLFVRTDPNNGVPQVSDLFRAAADVDKHPDPAAELKRKLRRPTEVKTILLRLAEENLLPRMGRGYYQVVYSCLTVLDQSGGFRSGLNWKELTKMEQALAFKDSILSFFAGMHAWFDN